MEETEAKVEELPTFYRMAVVERQPKIKNSGTEICLLDSTDCSQEFVATIKRSFLLGELNRVANEMRWTAQAGKDNCLLLMQVLLFIQQNRLAEDSAVWKIFDLSKIPLTFSVRVIGNGWDEHIDERGAQFILDIQRAVDSLFREVAGPEVLAPRLKFRVLKGSNKITAATKVLKAAIEKMSGTQIVIIGIVWAGLVAGCFCWGKYLQHEEKMQMSLHSQQVQRQSLELSAQNIDALKELAFEAIRSPAAYTKPLRTYVNSMAASDVVEVSGMDAKSVPVVKEELKMAKARHTMRDVDCDGVYTVTGIDMKSHPVRLAISQGEHKISASLAELPAQERTALVDSVRSALDGGTLPLTVSLRLSVRCSKHERKNAKVLGVGAPRTGITLYTLGELPAAIQAEFE